MEAEEGEINVMGNPICIIGDSITGGVVYLSDSAKYTHWKESFVNLLGSSLDSEMKNHSKFGCTSTAALKRLERYSKDIAACPTTLVMLGGNDSDFDWPSVSAEPEAAHDCNTPIARFVEYYNKVLDGIMSLGSKPVVINLIPVYGKRYFDWFSRKLDPKALMKFLGSTESIEHWNEMYNLAVMRIAAKRGIPMLDVRSAFLEKRNFDGLFSEDGIHPSPEGHRKMYEYVLPQARPILL